MFNFFLTLCFIVTKLWFLARLNSLIVIIVWLSNSSVCIWYEASKWNGNMLVKWLRSVLEILIMYLCLHWDARRWNHRERAPRTAVNVVHKTMHLLHSYRDVQDSCLNPLLQLNVYRYWSISWFDLSVMTYFWLIHPNFDKFRYIPR